ncbi:hypothetical protein ACHHYP_11519 [Achlya hypogyna]|uniref:Endonuclease/exonuclease/phosphatase domain-containing protein n=1 Tax=Achlya hypogyna TaxID=1202772 RepID=A0A1V9YJ17_ACHHY|nr:hypothetical protein ACHHYP_11519 [Achlya hypogyna]
MYRPHLQKYYRKQADDLLNFVQSEDVSWDVQTHELSGRSCNRSAPTGCHHRSVLAPASIHLLTQQQQHLQKKVSYILDTFSLSHDVAFDQEMRFPNIAQQEAAAAKRSEKTADVGRWFCCPPHFPTTPTGLACRGVANTVHPTSALHDLDVVAGHDAPPLVNRYLLVGGRLGQRTIYLHNVYAPAEPAARPAFFEALPRDFAANALHIIGGDFNVTLNDALDVFNPASDARRGHPDLVRWLNTLGVIDVFRHRHPTLCSYTSPTSKTRIYYIFVSRELVDAPHVEARHVFGTTRSNHAAIVAHIAAASPVGKGPWTVPRWLLDDPEVVATIHAHRDRFLATATVDNELGRHYDVMIFSLQQLCRLHAIRVAEERVELNELTRRLAQSMYDLGRYRTRELEQLGQHNRAKLVQYHTTTSAFRAEARLHTYLAESSRCTRLHLRPPTPRPLHRQTIQAVCDADGNRHKTRRGIEDTLHEFYTSLYAHEAAPPDAGMTEFPKWRVV